MERFREFIIEGGNVQIGDTPADRIDLSQQDRSQISESILKGLMAISKAFAKTYGIPIWNDKLFQNRSFLSGSSLHFFDQRIPDEKFKKYKPAVGDIDTQIDSNLSKSIEEFLNNASGSYGPLEYIGFKKSPGQLISLWKEKTTGLNIQVDLEFVDFENGAPTEWAQFSHSSSWADIEEGVKGVFHKYIIRAMTGSKRVVKDAIILFGKTKKPKRTSMKELAFSVVYGLRKKYAPVVDDNGDQQMMDGLPVYEEIPTKDSNYVTDIRTIFSMLFGYLPNMAQVQSFNSFIGIMDIVKKGFSSSEKKKLHDAYVDILWGPKNSQKLERANPEGDYAIKNRSYQIFLDRLGMTEPQSVKDLRMEYYKNY